MLEGALCPLAMPPACVSTKLCSLPPEWYWHKSNVVVPQEPHAGKKVRGVHLFPKKTQARPPAAQTHKGIEKLRRETSAHMLLLWGFSVYLFWCITKE